MSGIVGGAGSKSGVIGSTEIPGGYEEGIFSITAGSNSLWGSDNDFNYVKVGKLCWVSGSLRVNGGGNDMLISGLPFTCQADHSSGSGNAYGVLELYRSSGGTDTLYAMCSITQNTAVVRFNEVKEDSDTVLVTGDNNGYYGFTITYKTA